MVNQTYTEWECIVVDDASTEPVQPIVDSCNDSRIRYYRHNDNKGLSAARNTGLRLARGSKVAFLDDDDEWLPQKLERQVFRIKQTNEEVGLVYCWMEWVRNGVTTKSRRPKLRGDIFEQALDRQPLGNGSTWLLWREVALQHNGFDETLSRGIDGDFLRRLCRTHEVDYVPQVLVRYYVEHGHERITRSDEEGNRNAIVGQKTKLEKFGDELSSLPRQRSRIHADIAYRYGQLREWRDCLNHFLLAWKSDPASPRTYRNAAKVILSLKKASKQDSTI